MASQSVTGHRTIQAPQSVIFDLLADPSRHGEIDGSGSIQATKGEVPQRLSLGASFGMSMKRGAAYSVKNTVVAYEEDREIAWQHGMGGIWRYRLSPAEGGTLVSESFEYGGVRGRAIALLGFPAKNRAAIDATLQRLAADVGGGPRSFVAPPSRAALPVARLAPSGDRLPARG
ncbi:MAG: SRPBCC family protein, partial [Propionibacteriaceae bacterium]